MVDHVVLARFSDQNKPSLKCTRQLLAREAMDLANEMTRVHRQLQLVGLSFIIVRKPAIRPTFVTLFYRSDQRTPAYERPCAAC